MKAVRVFAFALFSFASQPLWAGDLTTDAAIGGAIGGAVGGILGAELGGRDGAIVGAGVGAAVGTAISTKDHESRSPQRDARPHVDYDRDYRDRDYRGKRHRPRGYFCPPGQAKKGRC